MGLLSGGIGAIILGAALVAAPYAIPALGAAIFAGGTMTYASLATAVGLGIFGQGLVSQFGPKVENQFRGSRRTRQQAVSSEKTAYGTVADGGDLRFMASHNVDNKILSSMFCLCAHETDGFVGLIINGKTVAFELNGDQVARFPSTDYIPVMGSKYRGDATHALIGVGFWNGTQTTADPYMVEHGKGKWTTDHVGRGHTMARLSMRYAEPEFQSGLPNVLFVYRGKKVYNWTLNTTAWSDNPIWCGLDWMRSEFGPMAPLTAFDQTTAMSAAVVCDGAVPLKAGGTTKRYRLSMIADASRPWRDVLADIENAMCGRIVFTGVPIKFYAGSFRSSVKTLTHEDVVGNVEYSLDAADGELCNSVTARYFDEAQQYSERETVLVTDQDYIDDDSGRAYPDKLDLLGVPSVSQAQRIAKATLLRRRRQETFSASFSYPAAMLLEPEDIVTLTFPPCGITAKLYRVDSIAGELIGASDSHVQMVLREYGDDFGWDANEEGASIIPEYDTTDDPTWDAVALDDFAVAHELRQEAGTLVTSVLRVSWSIPDEITSHQVEIRWRAIEAAIVGPDGTAALITDGLGEEHGVEYIGGWRSTMVDTAAAAAVLTDIEPMVRYEIQGRLTSNGNYGAFSTAYVWTIDSYVQIEPLYNVTGKQVDVDSVRLKWRVDQRRDVSAIEIFHATSTVLDDALMVVSQGRDLEHTVHKLPNGKNYFWIRSVQRDGRKSPYHVGAPLAVEVDAAFGKLAKLDRVTTAEIAPLSTTLSSSQVFDAKNSVGSSYEEAAFKVYDVPPRDGLASPTLVFWSLQVPSAAACTAVYARLKMDGVVMNEWTWTTTTKPAYPRDAFLLLIPSGRRRISLDLKTEGGSSTLTKIRLITLVNL